MKRFFFQGVQFSGSTIPPSIMQAFRRARSKLGDVNDQPENIESNSQAVVAPARRATVSPIRTEEIPAPVTPGAQISKQFSVSQLTDTRMEDEVQREQSNHESEGSTIRELRKKVARLEEEVHLKSEIVALQKELNSPSAPRFEAAIEGGHNDRVPQSNIPKMLVGEGEAVSEGSARARGSKGWGGSPLSLAAQRRIEQSDGSGYGSSIQREGSEAEAEAEFRSAAAAAAVGGAERGKRAAGNQDSARAVLHATLLRQLQREMAALQSARAAPASRDDDATSGAGQIVPDMHSKLSFAAQRRDMRWVERGAIAASRSRMQALDSTEASSAPAPAAAATDAAPSCAPPDCLQLSGAELSQKAGTTAAGGMSLTLIKGVGADR